MSKLNFKSILFEAYIPWPRFAGKLLKSLSGLQVEESLIKNFEGLSQRLGKSIFDFDPIKKTIQVIDWSKMARADVEEILRSSKIRNILYNELKNNGIDINDSSVRTTLTGVYRVLADSFVNSAKKVVTRDWTTSTVVKNFFDGMKLSVIEIAQMLKPIRKIIGDAHLKYYKQQEQIEKEVIKLTNDILQKRKTPGGLEKEFDELNKLFAQMVALEKAEHKIIWLDFEKKLPKEFIESSNTGKWNDKKYLEFIKYFQGELPKPPKVVFDKIDAAKKMIINPFNTQFWKSREQWIRKLRTLLMWEPRLKSEVDQTIRVYGTSKHYGKLIGDKLIFALVVFPVVTESLLTLKSMIIYKKELKSGKKSGDENVYPYVTTHSALWNNLWNFSTNTIINYLKNFMNFGEKLTTFYGWSPIAGLLNEFDLLNKTDNDDEKIGIIDRMLNWLSSKTDELKTDIKKDTEGTQIIPEVKKVLPKSDFENLDNNTEKPKAENW